MEHGYFYSVFGWEQDLMSEVLTPTWSQVKNEKKVSLAVFDLNRTLIEPDDRVGIPEDQTDFNHKYGLVTEARIKELHRNGYQVVVMANDDRLYTGEWSIEKLHKKFQEIQDTFEVPMIFVTNSDKKVTEMRKPNKGLWDVLLKKILKIKEDDIDKSRSFYCGDKAGRRPMIPERPDPDPNFDDIIFAENIGL